MPDFPEFFWFMPDEAYPCGSLNFEKVKRFEAPVVNRSVKTPMGQAKGIFVDGGKQWADVCRTTDNVIVVSEHVKNSFEASGLTGLEFSTFEVTDVLSPRLRKLDRPVYYWIRATGSLDVNIETLGITTLPKGEDGRFDLAEWTADHYDPIAESWSGHDVCQVQNPFPHGYASTRKLIDLAISEQWSNSAFAAFTPPKEKIRV